MNETLDTQQLTSLKILIIGESCLDEYRLGSVTRISPEAPVPVIQFKELNTVEGMAANVKNNVKAFNISKIDLITNTSKIIKRRFIDIKSNQQLLREDIGDSVSSLIDYNIKVMNSEDYDIVIISDYCKGLLTPDTAKLVCEKFKHKVYVDTKKEDLSCFPNSIIKINEYEDNSSYNLPISSTKIVTLGSKGSVCEGVFSRPSPVKVHDVTGAGDVFLASLAVLNRFKSIHESIDLANKLASYSVEHFGTYVINQLDIERAFNET